MFFDRFHAIDPCIQAPSPHIYTHILSVTQHIALDEEICNYSKAPRKSGGESDALFEIIHTRWANEGPGSSRFPFSQQWFLYMIVFLIFGGFFSFLSSSVTAYFPFWGKDVQALCRVLLLSWKASEKLNKAASRPLLVGWGPLTKPILGRQQVWHVTKKKKNIVLAKPSSLMILYRTTVMGAKGLYLWIRRICILLKKFFVKLHALLRLWW